MKYYFILWGVLVAILMALPVILVERIVSQRKSKTNLLELFWATIMQYRVLFIAMLLIALYVCAVIIMQTPMMQPFLSILAVMLIAFLVLLVMAIILEYKILFMLMLFIAYSSFAAVMMHTKMAHPFFGVLAVMLIAFPLFLLIAIAAAVSGQNKSALRLLWETIVANRVLFAVMLVALGLCVAIVMQTEMMQSFRGILAIMLIAFLMIFLVAITVLSHLQNKGVLELLWLVITTSPLLCLAMLFIFSCVLVVMIIGQEGLLVETTEDTSHPAMSTTIWGERRSSGAEKPPSIHMEIPSPSPPPLSQ